MSTKPKKRMREKSGTRGKKGSEGEELVELFLACDRCDKWEMRHVKEADKDVFNDVEYVCVECSMSVVEREMREIRRENVALKERCIGLEQRCKGIEEKYRLMSIKYEELERKGVNGQREEGGRASVSGEGLRELTENRRESAGEMDMDFTTSGTSYMTQRGHKEHIQFTSDLIPPGQGGRSEVRMMGPEADLSLKEWDKTQTGGSPAVGEPGQIDRTISQMLRHEWGGLSVRDSQEVNKQRMKTDGRVDDRFNDGMSRQTMNTQTQGLWNEGGSRSRGRLSLREGAGNGEQPGKRGSWGSTPRKYEWGHTGARNDSDERMKGVLKGGSAGVNKRVGRPGFVFFCGEDSILSNLSSYPVKYGFSSESGTETFPSSEHAYQCTKGWYHGVSNVFQRMADKSPREAMQIASNLHVSEEWKGMRTAVMRRILEEKCRQNPPVRTCLERSGSSILVEDTPHPFWGRGKDGLGENTLGRIWMDIRDSMWRDHSKIRGSEVEGGTRKDGRGEWRPDGRPGNENERKRTLLVLSDSMLADRGDMKLEESIREQCGMNVVMIPTRGASLGRAQLGVEKLWDVEGELHKRRVSRQDIERCCVMVGTNDLSNGFRDNLSSDAIAMGIESGLLALESYIKDVCGKCVSFGWITIMPRLDGVGMKGESMEVARTRVNKVVSRSLKENGWETLGVEQIFEGKVKDLLYRDGLHPSTLGRKTLVKTMRVLVGT